MHIVLLSLQITREYNVEVSTQPQASADNPEQSQGIWSPLPDNGGYRWPISFCYGLWSEFAGPWTTSGLFDLGRCVQYAGVTSGYNEDDSDAMLITDITSIFWPPDFP